MMADLRGSRQLQNYGKRLSLALIQARIKQQLISKT